MAHRASLGDLHLSAELAQLSELLTRRCSDVVTAAQRGGPERATLAARGHELQALQSELAANMPAAANGDTHAMTRVITLQRRTLALLDVLQGRSSPTPAGADLRLLRDHDPRPDIVTMRPAPGPEGQTLWVAEPSARLQPSSGNRQEPRSARPPQPLHEPISAAAGQTRSERPQPARKKSSRPEQSASASEPPAEAKSLLLRMPKQLGTTAQLAAAGAVVLALVATTASLVPTIASRLRPPADATAETVKRPKPSERLSANAATLPKTAATALAPEMTATPSPQKPPPGQAFVAIVATHDSFAAARQAFVTLKGLYPLPLANTAPDIRTVKGAGLKNAFELALLPALARSDADAFCRRLLGLGHVTCIVKRDP